MQAVMRIGIVGAAGTGKSTLARNLAAALDLPLIPDFVEEVLKEHGKDSWRGILDLRLRRQIRLDALKRKMDAEMAAERFVSDKTVIDYLAYWLQNQSEHETREQNVDVVEQVKAHIGRYDRCVFLPYRAVVDFGAGRSQDPVHNLKVAGQKRGLLAVLGVPTVDAPYDFTEDVQAWARKWLAPAAGAAAPAAARKPARKKR